MMGSGIIFLSGVSAAIELSNCHTDLSLSKVSRHRIVEIFVSLTSKSKFRLLLLMVLVICD